jgi:hypothetical protein
MDEVQAAARRLGVEVATIEIRRSEDVVPAFDTLKSRADASAVWMRATTAAFIRRQILRCSRISNAV